MIYFKPDFDPAKMTSDMLMKNRDSEICNDFSSICCPLFEENFQYSANSFSEETLSWLSEKKAAERCGRKENMPCCVEPELCMVYVDLPHCDIGADNDLYYIKMKHFSQFNNALKISKNEVKLLSSDFSLVAMGDGRLICFSYICLGPLYF